MDIPDRPTRLPSLSLAPLFASKPHGQTIFDVLTDQHKRLLDAEDLAPDEPTLESLQMSLEP